MAQTKRTNPPAIEVEPRPDGRWAVQKQGTQRASKVLDRKTGAVAAARGQSQREGAELIVKDKQGRIQSRDSHGHDPRSRPGGTFQRGVTSKATPIDPCDLQEPRIPHLQRLPKQLRISVAAHAISSLRQRSSTPVPPPLLYR